MDMQLIAKQAAEELQAEQFREAVEAYKLKLKTKKSLWNKIFPYKILIIKKEQ